MANVGRRAFCSRITRNISHFRKLWRLRAYTHTRPHLRLFCSCKLFSSLPTLFCSLCCQKKKKSKAYEFFCCHPEGNVEICPSEILSKRTKAKEYDSSSAHISRPSNSHSIRVQVRNEYAQRQLCVICRRDSDWKQRNFELGATCAQRTAIFTQLLCNRTSVRHIQIYQRHMVRVGCRAVAFQSLGLFFFLAGAVCVFAGLRYIYTQCVNTYKRIEFAPARGNSNNNQPTR